MVVRTFKATSVTKERNAGVSQLLPPGTKLSSASHALRQRIKFIGYSIVASAHLVVT